MRRNGIRRNGHYLDEAVKSEEGVCKTGLGETGIDEGSLKIL